VFFGYIDKAKGRFGACRFACRYYCPYVQYDFIVGETQEYVVCFYLSPRNPRIKGGTIKGCFSVNDNQPELFDIVQPNYYAEWVDKEWNYGVTNNISCLTPS